MQERDALGAVLTEVRKRRGISQRRLADLSGVSNTTIASLERGRGARGSGPVRPSPDTLRLLASGLSKDLVTGETDRRDLIATYTRLMEAAGYGGLLRAPEDMLAHQIASEKERQALSHEALTLGLRLTLLSESITEALENGKGAETWRELRFGVSLLEAYLDLIDPDREHRGPLGED